MMKMETIGIRDDEMLICANPTFSAALPTRTS